jgi:hypothetical protein
MITCPALFLTIVINLFVSANVTCWIYRHDIKLENIVQRMQFNAAIGATIIWITSQVGLFLT